MLQSMGSQRVGHNWVTELTVVKNLPQCRTEETQVWVVKIP